MLQKLKHIPIAPVMVAFLLIFFGVEAANKLLSTSSDSFIWQKAAKLLIFGVTLSLLWLQRPKDLLKIALISLIYVVGQYFLENAFTKISVLSFSRYLLFLSLVFLTTRLPENQPKTAQTVKWIFEGLVLLNSLLIILGFAFHWEVFNTYTGGRFGYNGLFMASSNSTYFYLLAFIYFIGAYQKKVFKQIIFWIALIACCFLGTKSIYLGILLFMGIMTFSFLKSTKIKLMLSLLIAGIIIIGSIIFFSSDLFSEIIQKEGWLTAILSYRDTFFIEKSIPYIQENWSLANYFFGGLENPALRPQLELIDLFLYMGIIGSILYLGFVIKHYIGFIQQDYLLISLFIVLGAVIGIAGNFFYNGTVPIYLITIKYLLIHKNKLSNS